MANVPHLYSYSQLGTYRDCSKKYEHYWISKNKRKEKGQAAEIGSLAHECIERFYLGEFNSPAEAFPTVIDEYLATLGLQSWKNELEHISSILSNLLLRASANYKGSDAIRTANGDVSKAPHMTKTWKDALKLHNLEYRIDQANYSMIRALPEEWRKIKMVTVYTEADHIVRQYMHPAAIAEVKAIEFGFSIPDYKGDPNSPNPDEQEPHVKNLVTLPSGRPFRGYIDLVGKLHDGRWVIIDHKTSAGDPPSALKVRHHEQLLLYAFFWHQLTGDWPAKIGISHLRTGSLIMADVDPKLALEAAERHDHVIKAIDKKIFLKHAPFEYGSPCIGREGTLEDACPYLPDCHKEVAIGLGWVDDVGLPDADDEEDGLPSLSGDTY